MDRPAVCCPAVGLGTNDLGMSKSNVLIMYYSALQSLTFTTGAATSTAAQRKWFPALAALTRAFAALHESEAAYRKVTKAMVSGASEEEEGALSTLYLPLCCSAWHVPGHGFHGVT
jgi:hypothetical protein